MDSSTGKNPSRRDFLLQAGALVAATSLGACGRSPAQDSGASTSAAPLSGSSAPELSELRFGIIALTDCSPLVIAHEKGLFQREGIRSTIVKGASWAAIRDS